VNYINGKYSEAENCRTGYLKGEENILPDFNNNGNNRAITREYKGTSIYSKIYY